MSNSIKIKNKLYKKFCRTTKPEIRKQLHESFKNYRNLTITLTRISKEKYYKSFFEDNKKDSKKVWEGIRSIINVKNEKSSNNISLNIDNETITDDLTISNHFNNFFTSVAKNLVNKIPKTPKSFNSCLKNSNENSFFLSLTTEEDFENILSTLKTNKRSEPGSVPTRIPKDFKKCLSKPISNLINLPFSLGTFPKILKQAKVISIFKKGDQQNCNNYRPVSLLSNISQIIEKHIHKQFSAFFEINNCL